LGECVWGRTGNGKINDTCNCKSKNRSRSFDCGFAFAQDDRVWVS
jgi:hypothetical protein